MLGEDIGEIVRGNPHVMGDVLDRKIELIIVLDVFLRRVDVSLGQTETFALAPFAAQNAKESISLAEAIEIKETFGHVGVIDTVKELFESMFLVVIDRIVIGETRHHQEDRSIGPIETEPEVTPRIVMIGGVMWIGFRGKVEEITLMKVIVLPS